MHKRTAVFAAAALLVVLAGIAQADPWSSNDYSSGFRSGVPISALGRPASWLNPSNFHVTSSLSFGTGFGGASEGLAVTSFSYQFKSPMFLNVSMGDSWGSSSLSNGGKPFLEGVDFGFNPMSNMTVRLQYRDFRSPLQYGNLGYNPYNNYWGR
jgi:hypothetical protein